MDHTVQSDQADAFPKRLSARYTLLNRIGSGGMGSVYVARDRLNGQQVALKRVDEAQAIFALGTAPGSKPSQARRLALAHEFQIMASLVHPNIVRVLDYGFDAAASPFYTMEWLEQATTIVETARNRSLPDRIELLLQLFQALEYLHRHRVLHRDLKPVNVLAVGGQIKVLDFGLSVSAADTEEGGGTLTYMAPELFDGATSTTESDLYAAGVIAYQVFSGRYPFPTDRIDALIEMIQHQAPDLALLDAPDAVREVVGRLMDKRPEERFHTAQAVSDALCRAAGLPPPTQPLGVRESLLQAARFVGRAAELTQLEHAIQDLKRQRGSAWLVLGESGIGKTRFVREVATRAMVEGMTVIRGTAVREAAAVFQLWREPLRWLSLLAAPDAAERAALRALLPDIDQLAADALQTDHPAADGIAPPISEAHLRDTARRMLGRVREPLVILLEDLHWAGAESLGLLRLLIQASADHPVLIIGTARRDERPELAGDLPEMQAIALERFSRDEVSGLVLAMLGAAGPTDRLTEYLARQSEGNVFFLIETIRLLAAERDRLELIGGGSLPEHLLTAGIRNVVARRLALLRAEDRDQLVVAAVVGRIVDLALLDRLSSSGRDWLERWVNRCVDHAILASIDGQIQFSHDKIRETLLANLAADEAQRLHGQVAEAIEALYPDVIDQFAALGYHWRAAGEGARALGYLIRVGDRAAALFVNARARQYYDEALAILDELPPTPERKQLRAETLIKRVNAALVADGPAVNLARLAQAAALIAEESRSPNDPVALDRQFRLHYAMGRANYYYTEPITAIDHFEQMRAIAAQLANPDLEAVSLSMIGRVLSLQGYFNRALPPLVEASEALRRSGNRTDWLWNLGYIGFLLTARARTATGLEEGQRAVARAVESNHASAIPVMHLFVCMQHWQTGDYASAAEAGELAIRAAEATSDLMPLHLAHGFRAWAATRAGAQAAALAEWERYDALVAQLGGRLVYADWFQAAKAEAALAFNGAQAAAALAQSAIAFAVRVDGILAGGIAHRIAAQAAAALQAGERGIIEEHFETSLSLLLSGDARLEASRTHYAWARWLDSQGNAVSAAAHFAAGDALQDEDR